MANYSNIDCGSYNDSRPEKASFSSNSFYGRRNKRPRIEKSIEEALQKKKTPTEYKPRLTGPMSDWKVFYRQQDAWSYKTKRRSSDLQVFAFESESIGAATGKRQYIVTSYDKFRHYYWQLEASNRVHYEIILEGAVCKLYFDLEFMKEYNPDRNGVAMVDLFIKYVCLWLLHHYKLMCSRDMIVDLDASTEKKFSRHLIFLLPNAAFRNNIEAGKFVRFIMSKVLSKLGVNLNQSGNAPSDDKLQTKECPDRTEDDCRVTSSDNLQPNECPDKTEGHCRVTGSDNLQPNECPDKTEGHCRVTGSDNLQPKECPDRTEDNCRVTSSDTSDKDKIKEKDENELSEANLQFKERYNGNKAESRKASSETSDKDNVKVKNEPTDVQSTHMESGTSDYTKKLIAKCNAAFEKVCEKFTDEDLKSFLVKDEHGETMFCDLGVYTKNRNFRLFKSSKYGKQNQLVLSAENQFQPTNCSPKESEKEKQIFLESLVANVRFTKCMRYLQFDIVVDSSGNFTCRNRRSQANRKSEAIDGYNQSVYPEIDNFVNNIVKIKETRGYIRHWLYFPQGEMLVYEIGNNRWCENVKRFHKSNNIMIIVDLKKGVYYQKCHDPDCQFQNFKSEDRPLPPNVLPSYFFDDQDELFDGDDLELMEVASNVEHELSATEDKLK